MSKWAELVLGAGVGALASEILNIAIKEAKVVLAFKTVSKDLASTIEDLLPTLIKIESFQKRDELKTLMDTIDQAGELVCICQGVKGWELHKKYSYTTKVWKIQKAMINFCQVQLQLHQHGNQLESMDEIKQLKILMEKIDDIFMEKLDLLMEEMIKINGKIDQLIPPPKFRPLCSVPELVKAPVGFDWPLSDLKKKLIEDDSVDCFVVSGNSGRGKTTLVTQLCHDARIKDKFKHIFFNVVSRIPNIRNLVQNLHEHNSQPPPTFADDDEAIYGLHELLKKLGEDGPILMVLDDVWLGGKSLLEKFKPSVLPGYKILVTSQFTFPSFGFNYELELLEDEDARILLIQWALRPSYASEAEYEDLLKKILRRCKGLPIVIEVAGILLKGQSLNTWKDKVESWSKDETCLDNPYQIVQSSYNALESNLKKCFLDMGSFLGPQKLYASVMIDIWVELYGKGSNSSSVYMKYLKDLASQNLLKLIPLGRKEPEDGFYNEFLVTQHDVFRELAICQSKLEAIMESKKNLEIREEKFPVWFQSELQAMLERKRQNLEIVEDNNIPDWCKSKLEDIRQSELEEILERKRLNLEIRGNNFPDWCLNLEKPINARLLCITTDNSFSSSWVEMDCPNVEVLVLNISSSSYTLPSFIEKMVKLKVVIIINHGFYVSRLSNFPCLRSLPNLKRIRLEKVSITFLDILRLQRTSLSKLSLFMCRFGEVSHDKKKIDVSNALPCLEEIDIDYCYDLVELPSWISEVVSLKTLSITNCNKLSQLPESIGNLRNLETLRLSSCISLVELPETVEKLDNLRFLDVSGCFQLKKFPLEIGNLQKLKKILMSDCYRCQLPASVRKLENLEVKCDDSTVFLWKRFILKMKNLTITIEEKEHHLNSHQQS